MVGRSARRDSLHRGVSSGAVDAMLLRTLPLVFVLVGLVLYTVLGGADFGAGMLAAARRPWRARRGEPRSRPSRDGARLGGQPRLADLRAHGHLDRLPDAFASVASTLSVPLFVAALGIILRGASYALRSGASGKRELRLIDALFARRLDADAVRARRDGRRDRRRARAGRQRRRAPVLELAQPDLDPHRGARGRELARTWRPSTWPPTPRAAASPLAAGVSHPRAGRRASIAGALALAGLVVLHGDAHSLYDGAHPRRRRWRR